MTIDEAIYCMKSYLPEEQIERCNKCPYYGSKQISENVFLCCSDEAHKMAIKALEHISKLEEIFDAWHEGDISHLDAYRLFEKELSQ